MNSTSRSIFSRAVDSSGRALVAVVLVAASATARAQDAQSSDSASTQAVLKERNRELMHPGEPLTLSGAEQRGKELRARTPALTRSDRRSECVDAEEQYHRTLAMFESDASFPTALRAGPGPVPRHARSATRAGDGALGGREDSTLEISGAWTWVFGFGGLLLAGIWTLGKTPRRRSHAPTRLKPS
jgi:hypothetical protein